MNAIKHGLSAKAIVIEGEDPRQFEALRAGLEQDFAPQRVIGRELIDDLAGSIWRKRRVPRFEAAIIRNILSDPLLLSERGKTREIENSLIRGDILTKLGRHETNLANRIDRTLKQLLQLQALRLEAEATTRLIESAIRPEDNSAEDNSVDDSAAVAATQADSEDQRLRPCCSSLR